MRTKVILVPAIALATALASTVTLERGTAGDYAVRAESEASALFIRRVFRSVSRAVSGAVRTVTRAVNQAGRAVTHAAKDVGKAVTHAAKDVGKAVTHTAKDVGKAVTKAAKGVGKAVQSAAKQIVKGVEGVAALAKKGLKAVEQAVKQGLMALKDLLGWVWKTMRDKLLKPVANYFKNAIERAKGALQKLVDKALGALQGVFMENVLRPALEWAFTKLFPKGQEVLARIKNIAHRILGKADRLLGQADAFAETLQAIAERNLAKYEAAMQRFDAALDKWSNVTLAELATELVAWAREKVVEFVRGRTVALLGKAYKLVESPINLGKTAALSAISSIPVVGGAISGAADVVITLGLTKLREAGFKFIADQAGALAGKAIDWAGGFLVKGAGALDAKLLPIVRPILATVKPWVDKALGMVQGVRSKWLGLRDKLRQARSFVQAAGAAGSR